jgi:hypothetical protein
MELFSENNRRQKIPWHYQGNSLSYSCSFLGYYCLRVIIIRDIQNNKLLKDHISGLLFLFRTMKSRENDVVLVRRTINLGCWEFGMGREWGGDGKGEVSLRVTWTGSYPAKEGFQVSKREVGLKQQGIGKGSKRQRGSRYNYVMNLYTCI